ncbi:pentapeptide repeat-containing protein [Pontibacter sp. JH31]|uniref:Pentapeptide repeat-containing protein n=1 Tax=Pontibacter aquaedesilientis TaxID=2766980 RepID=A0ABR7XK07_9BACT|nr:pentapeptide repeat-containing protein [Pontibacter aquaedesilientis]MBD1398644.1 pentapeptide repeat-containing protein [Pontibacter aquaedesilientis]
MKKLPLLLILLMLPLFTWAQTRVNASEIIAKINRGEAVSYKDVEIVGNLDMTQLQNMKLEKEPDNRYNTREYISTVTAPLTFVNCTFKGDVLAYFNPEGKQGNWQRDNSKNEVYNTNFEKAVRFENCVFEGSNAFKYSEFKGDVSFAGSRFQQEALFKYSKFSRSADFRNAKFGEEANFKYVAFPQVASFENASFKREANFKYAKFSKDADFRQANFGGLANFKYTKVANEMNLQKAVFDGDEDFKYTQVNNRKVSRADLVNN